MSKVKEFKKDVMHEINMLKTHATSEEKARLNFAVFDYESAYNCIYGQLTGKCTSKRAKQLMDLCCISVVTSESRFLKLKNISISNKEFIVNVEYKGQTWGDDGSWRGYFFRTYEQLSALEGYIYCKGAKNKKIIDYINGTTSTLTL